MTAQPVLEELWIVEQTGLTLYNQAVETNVNSQLFGSFMAAVNQLASQLGQGKFDSVDFGDYKLTFTHCADTNVMIIARSDPKVKDARIRAYLGKIREDFIVKFCETLKEWDGNVDVFGAMDGIVNLRTDAENWLGVRLDERTSRDVISQL